MRLLHAVVVVAGAVLLLPVNGCRFSGAQPGLAMVHGRVRPRPNTVFVREGRTTRNQVVDALQPFDSGASAAEFFWARWLSFRAPAAPHETAAVENFFIEFDPNGVASRSTLCTDAELLPLLWEAIQHFPGPPDSLSVPAWHWGGIAYLKGTPHRGTLSIDAASVRFTAENQPSRSFRIALARATRITTEEYATEDQLHLSLHFGHGARPVQRIKIEVSPVESIWLMSFLKHAGVPAFTD